MKKIDAHSHIGNFGGWAGVAFTKQKIGKTEKQGGKCE